MIHTEIVKDLAKSGLVVPDMNIRELGATETAHVRLSRAPGVDCPGYVIPYYNMFGEPLPFYRVRAFGQEPKYKQAPGEPNHVYFPPNLWRILKRKNNDFVLVVEGEKKAACAVKNGIPCVALTGVDSWRNKIIILPDDVKMEAVTAKKELRITMPSGTDTESINSGPLAVGLPEFIEHCVKEDLHVIICFDSDVEGGVKPQVQRAAAVLAYELRYRGVSISRLRQLVLPSLGQTKMGLDDYVTHAKGGVNNLGMLIRNTKQKRVAFPRHPDPRGFINKKLQAPKMSRKDAQDIALSILMEMESRGKRIRNMDSGDMYYFDDVSHELMPVIMRMQVPLHETSFGAYLYREYNVASPDQRLLQWLAAQYTGEPGVIDARTQRVLTGVPSMPDCIAYQVNNAHYIVVTPDPVEPFLLFKNGDKDVMFEQAMVKEMDEQELFKECGRQLDDMIDMHWLKVMDGLNFRDIVDDDEDPTRPQMTADQQRLIASLLCYASPWLLRWRGTQLPVELMIGEAGSGKTSTYTLRQIITTGKPSLANMTSDIKDWYASITGRGGVHVLDNVKFVASAKDYRQRLSDELCRLVTETDPAIELRKLYTTSDTLRLPVRCTFAMTAIEQPFFATDIIQRAAMFELSAVGGSHDSNWVNRQLDRLGGRMGWLAHHLVTLHRFLKLAVYDKGWNHEYKAAHRLANYEQILQLMAESFGLDSAWIPKALTHATEEKLSESDWTLQALKGYVKERKAARPDAYYKEAVTAQEIAEWAEAHKIFYKNGQVTNAWRLGRYMQSHFALVKRHTGLEEGPKRGNRRTFKIPKD